MVDSPEVHAVKSGVHPLKGRDGEVMPILFEEMAEGKTLKGVCAEYGWSLATVNLWAHSDKWRADYMRARECQGLVMGERVLEEAEEAAASRDYARIQGLRILVDSLKWLSAKHNPKLYGDNVGVTVSVRREGVMTLPAEAEVGPETGVVATPAERAGEVLAEVVVPGVKQVVADIARRQQKALNAGEE